MKVFSSLLKKCPICDFTMHPVFTAQVLGKYQAEFLYCNDCGFLQVHEPHWLEEAYSSAIASTDTGLVRRNFTLAGKVACVLYYLFGERGDGRYLDVAGGYGLLTRLMRDYGFDFYWSDKYCENLLARGFEYEDNPNACLAVTAFEVMEHLEDPVSFVREVLAQAKCDTIIFSTELFEPSPPPADTWWYYSLDTGQHIAFFQKRTLESFAEHLGLRFYSSGGIHLFTKRAISPIMFRICVSRASNLLLTKVRWRMGNRVDLDHKQMLGRLKNDFRISE